MITVRISYSVAIAGILLINPVALGQDRAPEAARLIIEAERYHSLGNIKSSEAKLEQASMMLVDGISKHQKLQCQVQILRGENLMDSGLIDTAATALNQARKIYHKLHDIDQRSLELQLTALRCRLLAADDNGETASRIAGDLIRRQNRLPIHQQAMQVVALSEFVPATQAKPIIQNAVRELYRLNFDGVVSTKETLSQLQLLARAQADLGLHADFQTTTDAAISLCLDHERVFVKQLTSICLLRACLYSQIVQATKHRDAETKMLKNTAISDLDRVIDLCRRYASDWQAAWFTKCQALHELGCLHSDVGEASQALSYFGKAVAEFPDKLITDDDPVLKEHTLAAVQEQRLNTLHRGWELVRLLEGEAGKDYATVFSPMRLIDAATQLSKTYEDHLWPSDARGVLMLLSLAGLLAEDNQLEEAFKSLEQAEPHIDVLRKSKPALAAKVRMMMGELRLVQPQPDVKFAKDDLESALDIGKSLPDDGSVLQSRGSLGLARIDSLTGLYADAIAQFTRIIQSRGTDTGEATEVKLQARIRMHSRLLRGLTYRDLGRSDLALADYKEIDDDKNNDLSVEDRFSLKLAQVEALIASGSDEDMQEIVARIDEMDAMNPLLLEARGTITKMQVIEFRHQQALLLYMQQKFEEASELWRRLIDLPSCDLPDSSLRARFHFYRSRSQFQLWQLSMFDAYQRRKNQYRARKEELSGLQSEYEKQEDEYNKALQLNERQTDVRGQYEQLQRKHLALQQKFDTLKTEYNELKEAKQRLLGGRKSHSNVADWAKDSETLLKSSAKDAAESHELTQQSDMFPNLCYAVLCNQAQVFDAQSRWYGKDKSDDADKSVKLLQRAIEHVEQPRAGSGGGEMARDEFLSLHRFAYDLLIGWHIEKQQYEDAWVVAERTRSRTFLDVMQLSEPSNRDKADSNEKAPLLNADDWQSLQKTREDLANLQRKLRSYDYEQRPKEMLDALKTEIIALKTKMPQQEAELFAKGLVAATFDEGKAREVLTKWKSSGDAFLSYYIAQNQAYLFFIDPGVHSLTCEVIDVELQDSDRSVLDCVDRLVSQATKYMESGTDTEVDAARAVRKALVPDAIIERLKAHQKTGKGTVYILPHGPLQRLSFAGLPMKCENTFLCDHCRPIAYASSALVFNELAQRCADPPPSRELLTMGIDADKDGKPRIKDDFTEESEVDFTKESEAVCKLFSDPDPTCRTNKDATKLFFLNEAAKYRFVHLSAHGVLNLESDNLRGHICLASTESNDGNLTVAELREMKLSAELVMLSACNTRIQDVGHRMDSSDPNSASRVDSTKLFGGEASNSISSALLVGGAKRVIGTHWEVDASSSRELVEKFFSLLHQKLIYPEHRLDYAALLSESQQHVRKQVRESVSYQHPYYWAGFTLQGAASDN